MKIYKVKVNGKVYEVELEAVEEKQGHVEASKEVKEEPVKQVNVEGGNKIVAPMQGTILNVLVKPGDEVKNGQVVAILEAMKLENEIISTFDGVVSEVVVEKGQNVNNQDLLMIIG